MVVKSVALDTLYRYSLVSEIERNRACSHIPSSRCDASLSLSGARSIYSLLAHAL
jgi:hypothetical protein